MLSGSQQEGLTLRPEESLHLFVAQKSTVRVRVPTSALQKLSLNELQQLLELYLLDVFVRIKTVFKQCLVFVTGIAIVPLLFHFNPLFLGIVILFTKKQAVFGFVIESGVCKRCLF